MSDGSQEGQHESGRRKAQNGSWVWQAPRMRDVGNEGKRVCVQFRITEWHRVTECLRVEGTSGEHPVQPSCWGGFTQSSLHRITSRPVLHISREGVSTTSLGSLFQCSVLKQMEQAKCTVLWQVMPRAVKNNRVTFQYSGLMSRVFWGSFPKIAHGIMNHYMILEKNYVASCDASKTESLSWVYT